MKYHLRIQMALFSAFFLFGNMALFAEDAAIEPLFTKMDLRIAKLVREKKVAVYIGKLSDLKLELVRARMEKAAENTRMLRAQIAALELELLLLEKAEFEAEYRHIGLFESRSSDDDRFRDFEKKCIVSIDRLKEQVQKLEQTLEELIDSTPEE